MGAYKSKFFLEETIKERMRDLYCDSEDDFDETYRKWWVYAHATCEEDLEREWADDDLPVEAVPLDPVVWESKGGGPLLCMEAFLMFDCMRSNPWAPLLFKAFLDTPSGMTFGAFMQLVSVLSPFAPVDVKAATAFRVFDINGTKEIQEDDILPMLEVLTGLRDLWKEAEEAPRPASKWKGPFPQQERYRTNARMSDEIARSVATAKKVNSTFAKRSGARDGDAAQSEAQITEEVHVVRLDDAELAQSELSVIESPDASPATQPIVAPAADEAVAVSKTKSAAGREMTLRTLIHKVAERVWAVMEAGGQTQRVGFVHFDRILRRDPTFREKFTCQFVRW